ncbi:MAG: hypothetical protein PVH03_09710 [Chloroflexota bacterium]
MFVPIEDNVFVADVQADAIVADGRKAVGAGREIDVAGPASGPRIGANTGVGRALAPVIVDGPNTGRVGDITLLIGVVPVLDKPQCIAGLSGGHAALQGQKKQHDR